MCVRACARVCVSGSIRKEWRPASPLPAEWTNPHHHLHHHPHLHLHLTVSFLRAPPVLSSSVPFQSFLSIFLSSFLPTLCFFSPASLSFGITPFSLPLSFLCQQQAHKRTGNYQGGEKVAANFPIYTFAQLPAFRFALRPPTFIFPIQTDPKQLHIYIGFILLGGPVGEG